MKETTVADRKSDTASVTAASAAKIETPAKSAGLITNLDELLASSTARGAGGGSKIRPDVAYVLITNNQTNLRDAKIPQQCAVMLKLLNAALASSAAITVNGEPAISEVEMNKLVVAAEKNALLKTKQDPWHIFRYYRTLMSKSVKDGGLAILKTVPIPVVPAATQLAA